MGTPGFMSPEQARGEPATAASDVFALGATLAYAATGQGPSAPPSLRVLMLRAAAGRTEKLPRTLPVEERRRLSAMLDVDPLRRPTGGGGRGGPAGTRPRPVVRTRVVPRGRRRRVAAGAAVALLTVGAVVAVATGRDGNGGALASPSTTAPLTFATEPCQDLPFQPCGEDPAPNTDGRRCLDGFADYDEDPANGCEAEPDDLPEGTELIDEISANLVPADDVDTFVVNVRDNVRTSRATAHDHAHRAGGVTQRVSLFDASRATCWAGR